MSEMKETSRQPLAEILWAHWTSWQFMEARIEVLTQELLEAKRALADDAAAAQRKAIESLKNGETTGDPFQDELVPWLGLDSQPKFQGFTDFNRKLIAAKGQELLLVCRYPLPDFPNGFRGEKDILFNWGYVFGVLSGERLRIPNAPRDPFFLPFERHFLWGWKGERGSGLTVNGPLELMSFIEPSVCAFSDWVIGKNKTAKPSLEDCGEEITRMFILIGDEINPERISKTGCPLSPNELGTVRKGLNAPTEAEKALASAI